jgi:hypothetical protein
VEALEELAFRADDPCGMVVLIGTLLGDLVEVLCAFEKLLRCDVSFERLRAHQRLGVIAVE